VINALSLILSLAHKKQVEDINTIFNGALQKKLPFLQKSQAMSPTDRADFYKTLTHSDHCDLDKLISKLQLTSIGALRLLARESNKSFIVHMVKSLLNKEGYFKSRGQNNL
jgi:hypothetical protein